MHGHGMKNTMDHLGVFSMFSSLRDYTCFTVAPPPRGGRDAHYSLVNIITLFCLSSDHVQRERSKSQSMTK